MRPPPSVLFTLSYGAGLATGLLHFGAPGCALAVTLLAAGSFLRRPLPTLLGAALGVGVLAAAVARAADRDSCASRLPAGRIGLT
ncbi:MAG TPA: hypothetical protein VHR41_18240, partial [Gemmatimonadales bacterium]|nr:hypothetical protein [Gemmatimonadales bacterium]